MTTFIAAALMPYALLLYVIPTLGTAELDRRDSVRLALSLTTLSAMGWIGFGILAAGQNDPLLTGVVAMLSSAWTAGGVITLRQKMSTPDNRVNTVWRTRSSLALATITVVLTFGALLLT